MKKRLLSLMVGVVVLVMVGCHTEEPTKPSYDWEQFCTALEQTEKLQYYDITESRTVGEQNSTTHIVLSNDSMGRTIAYKETPDGELWWYQGLTYDSTSGENMKYAQGINKFLDITTNHRTWEQSSVRDIQMSGNNVTFSFEVETGKICKVSARMDGQYIERISIEFNSDGGKTGIIEYLYKEPGHKPNIELPSNIDDYHY